MIRIKDYILDEKNIKQIWFNSDYNKLFISKYDSNYDNEIKQATFEDIEWNYGTQEKMQIDNLEKELNDLKSDYSMVVTENKKLKEENEKLKFAMQDTYDSANDTCGELQQRIDKAIKYIREKAILCDEWLETEPLNFIPAGIVDFKALSKKNVEELLKILKAEEK